MAGLTKQALIVSASRFLNQGLMIVSPVILARLLSVAQFGEYREFLLYTTLLANLGAFSLANSLLYFVGLQPLAAWGYVRRVTVAVAVMSIGAVAVFAGIEFALGGRFVGDRLLPCVLYTLLYVNVDFWEHLWLARKNPQAVLAYTAARLLGRILIVIGVGWVTRDVDTIIWSLVAYEALRIAVSAYWWRRLEREEGSEVPASSWREMLNYSVPSGIAVFITTFNSSIGGVVIDSMAGEAALALFVIGGYVLMIVYPVRNSVSDVMLPELAAQVARGGRAWLGLWNRSVVIFAILLWPVSVLLVRYAEPFVEVAFSEKYAGAAPVLQWYSALLALSCVDLGLAVRALNRTRVLLVANVLLLCLNLVFLMLLVPGRGPVGAAMALTFATVIGLSYLVFAVARSQSLSFRDLVPLAALARIALACAIAAIVIVPGFWTDAMGAPGAAVAGLVYLAVFVATLVVLRVEEASLFIAKALSWARLRGRAA
jgi:O-antigen/teichoic acid export membrane protein